MDSNTIVKNVSVAFVAQALTFAVSTIVTFLVPKVLNVENFGYWQLFVFYSTYVGFFMLGLNDGCYLLNGGKRRDEIDKTSVNSQFIVGLVFELAIGTVLVLVVLGSSISSSRSFVLYCIGAFIPLRCSAAFLGYVFQAINETRLYSVSCIIERLTFLIVVIILLLLRIESFHFYVLAFCFSTLCQFVYCCFNGKDILHSGMLPIRPAIEHSLSSVRVGIKLMLANIASSLIIGIARASIDATWGISSFGQLSLSLSLCNFFLAFVSQFAMVLFPALRQSKSEEIRSVTTYSRDFLTFFMPIVYLLQFPMFFICSMWLPQYVQGLGYLSLVLPICVFDSKTNLCGFTYFKVARMEGHMLAVNIVTVFLSALGVAVGIAVFRSVDAVILSVVVCIIGRSFYCERLINKKLQLSSKIMVLVGELTITVVFIVSHYFLNTVASLLLCTALYVLFLLCNYKVVRSLMQPILRRLHHI